MEMIGEEPKAGVVGVDHVSLSFPEAVVEFRRRMKWRQRDLAQAIANFNPSRKLKPPSIRTIYCWEAGTKHPSDLYAITLGRLAATHGHKDLANIFHPLGRLITPKRKRMKRIRRRSRIAIAVAGAPKLRKTPPGSDRAI